MIRITYRCGCKEEGEHASLANLCPIHQESVGSAVVIGSKAFELAYGGPLPPTPAGGLFWPKIEGMRGAA